MLTAHQEKILEESLTLLQTNNTLLIKGSAGVGKTFMANELIKRLPTYGKKVYCSAPTNKAVKVIKEKVDVPNKEVVFITTHAALKMKRVIDFKTGAISFTSQYSELYPPLKGVSLLIVDEASMLNTDLLLFIEEHSLRQKVKVVYLGDEKQINPVGENNSPVFHQNYSEVELTEIIRQGEGNPIIDLSRNLNMLTSRNDKVNVDLEGRKHGYLNSNNKAQVIETLAAVNGTDALKYLAWTNQEVDKINTLVRQRIYGTPSKVELEEVLVFNSPYNDYFTNEEIKVKKLEIKEKKFTFVSDKSGSKNYEPGFDPYYGTIKLKYYNVNAVENEDAVIIIHEDSEKAFKNICGVLKQKAKYRTIDWIDYLQFVEKFADITYNHALTIHKSQGSTYLQTIINVKNINLNRNEFEKERLKYTAVTRAKELLILYNNENLHKTSW